MGTFLDVILQTSALPVLSGESPAGLEFSGTEEEEEEKEEVMAEMMAEEVRPTYMCSCRCTRSRGKQRERERGGGRKGKEERKGESRRERREENRDEVKRKERRKEKRTAAPRRAGGLPRFRQEDVTVNPRPPASDEPTRSLARPAARSLLLLLLGPRCVRVRPQAHARPRPSHVCMWHTYTRTFPPPFSAVELLSSE